MVCSPGSPLTWAGVPPTPPRLTLHCQKLESGEELSGTTPGGFAGEDPKPFAAKRKKKKSTKHLTFWQGFLTLLVDLQFFVGLF